MKTNQEKAYARYEKKHSCTPKTEGCDYDEYWMCRIHWDPEVVFKAGYEAGLRAQKPKDKECLNKDWPPELPEQRECPCKRCKEREKAVAKYFEEYGTKAE